MVGHGTSITDLPEDAPEDQWWGVLMQQWDVVCKLAGEHLLAGDAAMVKAYAA